MFSYLAFVIMGIIVGLVGGGGAILTVPILVYLFHIDPILATFYSLLIVGSTTLIGTLIKIPSKEIVWKVGIIFGIPAVIATYFSRHILVPSIPDHFLMMEKGSFLLIIFAIIMFGAGCSMVCKKTIKKEVGGNLPLWKKIIITVLEGGIVGTITGLVGAGGGFLIVPALMMLEGLTIKQAVATSLLIITAKSLIGSLGDLSTQNMTIDFQFLIIAIVIAIVGLFIGLSLQAKIDGNKLSRWFGISTMIVAILMVIKEIFFHS